MFFRLSTFIHQHPGPASQWLQDVLENQVTEPLQPLRPAWPLRRLIGTGPGPIPRGVQDPAEGEEKDELWHLGRLAPGKHWEYIFVYIYITN